jgi:selenide,water dikinase
MMEAGCAVIGGHSVRDQEMKFGYSVTGLINPARVFSNAGCRPGDHLVFTKALGTGVICTAIKNRRAEPAWVEAAVRSMTTLNKKAAELIATNRYTVHTMTDVTGFGFIAHAREMALASNVALQIFSGAIAVLPGAFGCVRAGDVPGGLKANRDFAECVVSYEKDVPEELRTILYDPQTAGGLLISIAPDDSEKLVLDMNGAGIPASKVGNVTESTKPLISIY